MSRLDQRRLWATRQEDLDIAQRATIVHETAEDTPPDLKKIDSLLEGHKDITHVFAVYCETTSGILNPIADIANSSKATAGGY